MRRLGIEYPVALDNDYGTWNAFQNQYWPAKYLIDRRGHLRYYHFGEGEYDTTESRDPHLLGESAAMLPVANRLSDPTPKTVLTPETYLGYAAAARAFRAAFGHARISSPSYHFPSRRSAAERVRLRGHWLVDRRGHRRGPRRAAPPELHRTGSAPRARRPRLGGRLPRRKRKRTVRVHGSRLYTLLECRRCGPGCSSSASAPAFGAMPLRSARAGPTARWRRAHRRRSALVLLAQEARELGRKGVSGREIGLLGERVRALLELLDVRRRVGIGGDRLRDLLRVVLGRPRPARSCRSRPRAGRRAGRRARVPPSGSASARRSAGPRPTGSPRRSRPGGTRRGGRRRSQSGPRTGRPRARAARTSSWSVALPVTGQGLVCGTSASSAPRVTTSSMPSSSRNPTIMSVNVRQRRFGSIPSSSTTSRSSPGGRAW